MKLRHAIVNYDLVLSFVNHRLLSFLSFFFTSSKSSRRFCRRASNMHVACSTCSSKCSEGKPSFKTPPCFCYLYFFCIFFFLFPPGPDKLLHPSLISRKRTGQQYAAQGWVLKMHVSPLHTHTHMLQPTGEQAFSLLWGREPQADKNSTQGNDMHDYRLHAHMVDQCWSRGHFPSRAQINRKSRGHGGVRGVHVRVEMRVCSGWEVFCQLIVFSRPCACQ